MKVTQEDFNLVQLLHDKLVLNNDYIDTNYLINKRLFIERIGYDLESSDCNCTKPVPMSNLFQLESIICIECNKAIK